MASPSSVKMRIMPTFAAQQTETVAQTHGMFFNARHRDWPKTIL